MTDRLLNIATVAAITVQVGVGFVFFGALTMMTLMGFSVIPGPY